MSPRCSAGSVRMCRLACRRAHSGAPVAGACRRRAHGSQPSRQRPRHRLPSRRSPNRKASNSPMRSSTGRRRRAPGSPMRFMKNTDCSRSVFPALRRTPPDSCSRRRWPRSRRRSRPIDRICRRTSSRTACFRTPSSKASSTPARRIPISSRDRGRSTRPSTSSPPRRDDAENAVRFRRGWFLGDGTGAGKGRQVAGILLDNWLKGRRRAVWISKSDKLIEDAQRDWSALGMERLLVTPLSRFRQGAPIRLAEGVLFATYATLRTDERGEKLSRVRQIVEWLGSDFDGVIVFDESHAMQNAAGAKSERGDQAASQQGRAGLRLQHALAERPRRLRLGDRRDHRPQPRLCPAPRPLGRRGLPVRDARRIRRGDRGGRRRGDGGACARSEGARPLRRTLALLRGRRIRARRAPAHPGADPHLRRLRRGLLDHPQQSRRGDAGREHHRRDGHAQRPGEGRRAVGLRIPPSSASSVICSPR